jgi:uncharacterized phiE125 gp8 family phage protein
MAIKRIGLATDVITLSEAKIHLRILAAVHPDDPYISSLITAAREWCELYTERAIGTQTLEIALDAFPNAFVLVPSVQSVTSVKYLDVNNVEQTVTSTDYVLDNYSNPAWLVPAYSKVWPAIYCTANAVKVRFVAGYDVSNPCPQAIIAAMKLMIGHLYENRQEDVLGNTRISFNSLPMGVYALLQPYRLNMGI